MERESEADQLEEESSRIQKVLSRRSMCTRAVDDAKWSESISALELASKSSQECLT